MIATILAFAQEAGEHAAEAEEKVNPILPATNEIIWGALSFAVLLFFMVKKGFPAVKKGMDARAEKIKAALDEAEKAKDEADTILDEYRSQAGRRQAPRRPASSRPPVRTPTGCARTCASRPRPRWPRSASGPRPTSTPTSSG